MPPKSISPSQADQFQDCARKWGFRYLNGLKVPPKPSARVGTRCHEIIEGYLQFGIAPNHEEQLDIEGRIYYPGRAVEKGLYLLPPPNPQHAVERSFEFGRWNGRADLLTMEDLPVLWDHKTSTDPKLWGKSESDLQTDVQSIVYSKALLANTGAPALDLRWTYFQTREPYKPRQTKLRLTVLQVDEVFGHWDEVARQVLDLYSWKEQGLRAEHLPPNPSACQKFGGCPYLSICPISDAERVRGYMSQQMSMLEKIAAARTAPAGQVVNAATQATSTTVAMPEITDWIDDANAPGWQFSPSTGQRRQVRRSATPNDVEAIKAGFMAGLTAAQIGAQLSVFDEHVSQVVAYYSATWVPEQRAGKVNPPEAPTDTLDEPDETPDTPAGDQFDAMDLDALKRFIADNGLVLDIGRKKAKSVRQLVRVAWKDRETAARLGEAAPVAQPVAQLVAQPQVSVATSAMGNEQYQPQPVATQSVATVYEAIEPLATDRKPTSAQLEALEAGDDPPTFRLFVDCTPRRTLSDVMTVRQAFPEAFAYVERVHGVVDYRLAQYGRGPAEVSAAIRALQTSVPLSENVAIVISLHTPEGQHFLEVLQEMADEVVIGT